ncbi:hypothetical protein L6R53_11760 [Myxococcota bacterium]|nr:hypothetical protein [Myxococcota bacterium]
MTPSILTLTATLCQSGQCLDLCSTVNVRTLLVGLLLSPLAQAAPPAHADSAVERLFARSLMGIQ